MRIMLGTLGLVVGLSVLRCGDGTVTEGTVPFKETNTDQWKEMKEQMIGNMKTKAYIKKQDIPPVQNSIGEAPAGKAR